MYECLRCAAARRTDAEDLRRALQGWPRDHDRCRDGDDLCLPCHEQCNRCTWFDDAHCVSCKHVHLFADEQIKDGPVPYPTVPHCILCTVLCACTLVRTLRTSLEVLLISALAF